LTTPKGARFCLTVALAVFLFPSTTLFSFQDTLDVRAQARKALDAASQGRHDESYKIWVDLFSAGPAAAGEDLHKFARSQIYMEAYKKVAESGEDCSRALEWTAKGKLPGPPDYQNPADGFYPLLIMVEGVCHAKREEYELAYTQLSLSKAELQKIKDTDMAEAIGQADHYLELVKEHVISEGDYVTNRGMLQTWIGWVRARNGNDLLVEITYANKDLGVSYGKGQQVEIDLSECKELGAISADAALKGWSKQ
jgi:hypothetical protein